MKFKGKSGAALRKLSVEPGRVSSSRAAWRACEGQQLKEICWGAADQKLDSDLARNNKQLTATCNHPSSSSWWERSLLTARCEKMYQQLSQGTCQGSRISTKAGTWQSRKLHDYAKKLEQFEQENTGKKINTVGRGNDTENYVDTKNQCLQSRLSCSWRRPYARR